jgi:dsRNA-specific ribonuclease
MAQTFVENVFEKHVDWTNLINNDDNYKNKLQVIIQKEFNNNLVKLIVYETTNTN